MNGRTETHIDCIVAKVTQREREIEEVAENYDCICLYGISKRLTLHSSLRSF